MFQMKKRDFKQTVPLAVVLAALFLLAGIIPMFMQSRVMVGYFRQNLIDARMKEIQNQSVILSNKMTRTGYMVTEPRDTLLDNEMNLRAEVYNGRIVIVDRNYRIIRDTFSLSEGKYNISEEVIKCFQGENSNKYNSEKHYSALTIPIYDDSPEKRIVGVMVVTASTEDLLAQADAVGEKANFLQIMTFWILLVAVILLAKMVVRPFNKLQKKLDRVAEGNLEENIHFYAYKETRGISQAVSKTLTKLKAVDQSREEFVSNVSHELKTPITSIRVLADSLMGMEEAPIELYREFMADISDEIDRESKIIDDLLTLVRMDKTAGSELNIAQVNINALLELILKRLRPIAKRWNIELIFESIREVTADVDEVKLSLALSNLVENAIKYNKEDGWVRVTLDADHKFFYVKVADSGIGIPEGLQEHVFERFYRVDKARTREAGGTGLGLAITRSAVLMHQGAIKLQSKEGEGTTFTVRIPLIYIP